MASPYMPLPLVDGNYHRSHDNRTCIRYHPIPYTIHRSHVKLTSNSRNDSLVTLHYPCDAILLSLLQNIQPFCGTRPHDSGERVIAGTIAFFSLPCSKLSSMRLFLSYFRLNLVVAFNNLGGVWPLSFRFIPLIVPSSAVHYFLRW